MSLITTGASNKTTGTTSESGLSLGHVFIILVSIIFVSGVIVLHIFCFLEYRLKKSKMKCQIQLEKSSRRTSSTTSSSEYTGTSASGAASRPSSFSYDSENIPLQVVTIRPVECKDAKTSAQTFPTDNIPVIRIMSKKEDKKRKKTAKAKATVSNCTPQDASAQTPKIYTLEVPKIPSRKRRRKGKTAAKFIKETIIDDNEPGTLTGRRASSFLVTDSDLRLMRTTSTESRRSSTDSSPSKLEKKVTVETPDIETPDIETPDNETRQSAQRPSNISR